MTEKGKLGGNVKAKTARTTKTGLVFGYRNELTLPFAGKKNLT